MDIDDKETRELLAAIGESQDGGKMTILKHIDGGRNVCSPGSALNEMIVAFVENASEPQDVLDDMRYAAHELGRAIEAMKGMVI